MTVSAHRCVMCSVSTSSQNPCIFFLVRLAIFWQTGGALAPHEVTQRTAPRHLPPPLLLTLPSALTNTGSFLSLLIFCMLDCNGNLCCDFLILLSFKRTHGAMWEIVLSGKVNLPTTLEAWGKGELCEPPSPEPLLILVLLRRPLLGIFWNGNIESLGSASVSKESS